MEQEDKDMQAANQNTPPKEVEFEKAIDEVVLAGLKSLGGYYVAAYLSWALTGITKAAPPDMRREVFEYIKKEIGH